VAQWAMERTIGNLREEIKQHSDPYINISERGVCHCQVNTLKALIPDLEPVGNLLPHGSEDVGGGFILLRALDRTTRKVTNPFESAAICKYLERNGAILTDGWEAYTCRWARVCLPNGQVARSLWKEIKKSLDKLCTSRNLKVTA
jgi:hypothetical protein